MAASRILTTLVLLLPLRVLAADPPLANYTGTYIAADGQVAELIDGAELVAVIDEAKYRLRRLGGDDFANPGGRKIPFHRDAGGRITEFVDGSVVYRRIGDGITEQTRALMRPRVPSDYHYRAPPDLNDGIVVGTLADSDIGVAVGEKIVRGILDETWRDVHGVLLYQRGHLVLEEYFYGYDIQRTHQMRSATKSIVSALAGIAADRGKLDGAAQPVLSLMTYPSYANPDPRKQRITLGDLLAMRSGLSCNDYDAASPGNEQRIYEFPDWVKATLDLPMAEEPGRVARYCSGGVAVVGRATENVVKVALPDFARDALFAPLGIKASDWRWNYTLTNANKEYSQLHMRPRDMLKIGLMYADGGRWHGKQIVSSAWVHESLTRQSQIDGTDYGYFWWLQRFNVDTPQGKRVVQVSAAQGNGGQKIFIVPEFDLVAVFTGGGYNAGSTPPNKIMTTILLPALIQKSALTTSVSSP
jgi:CubicO group peptidase (beta-lactamase class C family)